MVTDHLGVSPLVSGHLGNTSSARGSPVAGNSANLPATKTAKVTITVK